MALEILAQEKVWLNKSKYADAERVYYEKLSKAAEYEPIAICSGDSENADTLKIITDLKNNFQKLENRVSILEGTSPNKSLSNSGSVTQDIEQLQSLLQQLEIRVSTLESKKVPTSITKTEQKETSEKLPEEDEDVDLFGSESDEESEEALKLKAQRVADYTARKSKKPTLIAKSNIILDVKPWDDETDMKELEKAVRQVATDGLLWGASKLVPLAYGIHKLQISCVVEDEKVSIDWLQETLQEIEDYIQSVDIAAFNKI
ncbi:Hypothetical protein CINCED_3A019641 [Cinara cedri]|uniref:Elongation factor 1-delta n=1 Tax=Cinara cedri TaxID=506608 RepID=A0A5E4LYR1_9HEMI|nr:Hypothetical protein CINCED_3A019641 [Cinara cedri]